MSDIAKVSITLNDALKITLDFGGDRAHHGSQFIEYCRLYDLREVGTLLNIKTWAKARGIPCTIKIHNFFSLWGWMVRILIVLEERLEKTGQGVVRPERWKKK